MRNQIAKLDLGVSPEAAVSGGFLIQTEQSAYLLFNAMRRRADGMREDDSTFECHAEDLSVEVYTEPYGAVIRRITERALEDPH